MKMSFKEYDTLNTFVEVGQAVHSLIDPYSQYHFFNHLIGI